LDINQNSNKPEKTPYEILGVNQGASFENIQKARDAKVKEAGDDLIAKAKIESSYDQLLMGSLKARQSGTISSDAQNASLKENQVTKTINSEFPLLSKIKNLSKNSTNNYQNFNLAGISSQTFDQLSSKLALGLLFLIILFVSPDPYNRLLLSLSTLILTYSQIRSGKKFFGSLGWSVVFLSIGLIFGGLIETNSFIQEVSSSSITVQKIQSLPAMIILWLGIIFL
tara:strand:+ start:792 stop:1469 length:678 start_codon:yes stop_codon:yes gene_type:complete